VKRFRSSFPNDESLGRSKRRLGSTGNGINRGRPREPKRWVEVLLASVLGKSRSRNNSIPNNDCDCKHNISNHMSKGQTYTCGEGKRPAARRSPFKRDEELASLRRQVVRLEGQLEAAERRERKALGEVERRKKLGGGLRGSPDEGLLGVACVWFTVLMGLLTIEGPNMHMLVVSLGLVSIFSATVIGYPFRVSRVSPLPLSLFPTNPPPNIPPKLPSVSRSESNSPSSESISVPSLDSVPSDFTESNPRVPRNSGLGSDGVHRETGLGLREVSGMDFEGKGGDLRLEAEAVLVEVEDRVSQVLPGVLVSRFAPVSELGLDSLTSDLLCRQLTSKFGVPIAPADLPILPSLVHLANHIAMAKYNLKVPPLPLLPAQRPGFSLKGKQVWSSCDVSRFRLRLESYKRDKRKGVSKASYYDAIGVDLLSTTTRLDHVARFINFETFRQDYLKGDEKSWRHGLPAFFVVNFQLPLYEPSIWGASDGPGVSLVFYFRLTREGIRMAQEEKGPSLLLKRFCGAAGVSGRAESEIHSRWKNIVHINNKDTLNLSFVTKNLVQQFSGKPFLTRSKKHIFRTESYLEVDINQHTSNYVKKRTVFNLKEHLASMSLDVGFLVEAQEENEMPERLIGSVTLKGLDYERHAVDVEWNRIVTPS